MKPDPKSSFKLPRGAVVSACGNSGQWQHALALLSQMQRDGIRGHWSHLGLSKGCPLPQWGHHPFVALEWPFRCGWDPRIAGWGDQQKAAVPPNPHSKSSQFNSTGPRAECHRTASGNIITYNSTWAETSWSSTPKHT